MYSQNHMNNDILFVTGCCFNKKLKPLMKSYWKQLNNEIPVNGFNSYFSAKAININGMMVEKLVHQFKASNSN